MNTHAMIQHLPLVPHQMTVMMLNDINIQINVIIFPEMELHCRTIKSTDTTIMRAANRFGFAKDRVIT